MGNYHWYLKQSLDFGRDPQKAPICVCWDPECPLRLHVVTRSWSSISYDWGWTTERSPGLDAADSASVAVIDGGQSQKRGKVVWNETMWMSYIPPQIKSWWRPSGSVWSLLRCVPSNCSWLHPSIKCPSTANLYGLISWQHWLLMDRSLSTLKVKYTETRNEFQ